MHLLLSRPYSGFATEPWDFVSMLRAEGRRAAGEFLEASADDLGQRSTADLDILLAEC